MSRVQVPSARLLLAMAPPPGAHRAAGLRVLPGARPCLSLTRSRPCRLTKSSASSRPRKFPARAEKVRPSFVVTNHLLDVIQTLSWSQRIHTTPWQGLRCRRGVASQLELSSNDGGVAERRRRTGARGGGRRRRRRTTQAGEVVLQRGGDAAKRRQAGGEAPGAGVGEVAVVGDGVSTGRRAEAGSGEGEAVARARGRGVRRRR